MFSENANDSLKGRILEVSLADLNKDEEQAFRKIKLRVHEVQGKNCLTNFHGMDFTSDKLYLQGKDSESAEVRRFPAPRVARRIDRRECFDLALMLKC